MPIAELSTNTNFPYLYTGKEFLENFGVNWYDHHARYFDPEIGRWWAIDPALQGVSPYMAMGNNPVLYVDENGEFFIEAMIIGGLINLLANSKKIDSFWDGFGYFAVGAAAGALSAGTSGAAWSLINGGGLSGFTMGVAPTVMGIGEGLVVGAASGFSGGFISGAGNAWMGGAGFGEGLGAGANLGMAGAITGGVIGGISGGINAYKAGRNIWNGNLDYNPEMLTINNPVSLENNVETSLGQRKTYSEASIEIGDIKSNGKSFLENAKAEYLGLNEADDALEIYNKFQKPIGLSKSDPWCSGFTNRVFDDVGVNGTGDGWARNWLNWGRPADSNNLKRGMIAIFSRGKGGHVGIIDRIIGNKIFLFGGNQSNSVNISTWYPKSKLLGVRWY